MNDDIPERLHVPQQWEALDYDHCRGLLMVVGAPDTGKSTFGEFVARKLSARPGRVAFIDGDPGQSRLGPPSTISLRVPRDDNRRTADVRRVFVGSVSPAGHMLPVLSGALKLLRKARAWGCNAVIYDTSGLVDPDRGGIHLKLAKIEILVPNRVFAIQRERELEPLLAPLQRLGSAAIEMLRPSPGVRRRNAEIRRNRRQMKFADHFSGARRASIDLDTIALFPGPALEPGRLVALEDSEGFASCLGIVRKYHRERGVVELFSPFRKEPGIKAMRAGSLLLDPHTFEGRIER